MGSNATDPSTEVVDAGDRQAEAIAILRYYLARAKSGELTGLMVIAEYPLGGYHVRSMMSGTNNVAERLGRLELLRDDIKALATESDV